MRLLRGFCTTCLLLGLLPLTSASAALQSNACSQVAPGAHWIDGAVVPGIDTVSTEGMVVYLDLDNNGVADRLVSLNACEAMSLRVRRGVAMEDSVNFPGLSASPMHDDVIDTEILTMCLTGDDITLRAGLASPSGIISPSLGAIVEDLAAPAIGKSFFDVFFEVDLGGGVLVYNQVAFRVEADLRCLPPAATYLHAVGDVDLFVSPIPGVGLPVGRMMAGKHMVNVCDPVFSIDYQSPTRGLADCAPSASMISDGDILAVCPAGVPAIPAPGPPNILTIAGPGPGPTLSGLGLPSHVACAGALPGVMCPTELDALSYGCDGPVNEQGTPGGVWRFSVDEWAVGIPPLPGGAPNMVSTESAVGDAAADVFTEAGPMPAPPLAPFAADPGNIGVLDGNGLMSGTLAVYAGLGLTEPTVPGTKPNDGDNLDALDVDTIVNPDVIFPVYFSLDSAFPDPRIPATLNSGSASAQALGFVGGDVLATMTPSGAPAIYAPAATLGLDLAGIDTDDLDALALFENGVAGYQPSLEPYDWGGAGTDMLLFSVRSGSAVIGSPDSIYGIPIQAGDILTTPCPTCPAPGGTAFPGIFIAQENLGLESFARLGGVGVFPDDLDAVDYSITKGFRPPPPPPRGCGMELRGELIWEGDLGWSGNGIVESIDNVDVNNCGSWLVEADGGSNSFDDNGIVYDGTLIFQEGTSLGFPASHTMIGVNDWVAGTFTDAMDLNDNGDILVHLGNCIDLRGLSPNRDIVMWIDGNSGTSHALLEEQVTPVDTLIAPVGSGLHEPPGAVWNRIDEVWQNNNNQMVVMGQTTTDTDDLIVFLEHDGAGNISSQTLIASDGVRHDLVFGGTGTHLTNTQSFSAQKNRQSLNNNGEFLYYLDDDHAPPGDTNADSHVYLYTHSTGAQDELLAETDLSPMGTNMAPYMHFTVMEADRNDSGTWVASLSDDGPAATNVFVQVTDAVGTVSLVLLEGSLAPGTPGSVGGFNSGGGSHGNVSISAAGDVTYFLDWDDPDVTKDSGLFRNDELLIQEGVTMVGTSFVDTVSSLPNGMAVSDNGRYIIVELTLDNGLEGAFMIDLGGSFNSFCTGDGGNQIGCTDCPCGNNTLAGSNGGCINSSGLGTQLIGSGATSVSLPPGDTGDLRFGASGAPAGAFCILNSGDAVAPSNMGNPCFGLNSGAQSAVFDGLRCAIANTRRHGGRSADLNGEVGVTNNPWGGEGGPPVGLANAGGGFAAGQTRFFQIINRDDPFAVCGRGLNTSQAIEVTFSP